MRTDRPNSYPFSAMHVGETHFVPDNGDAPRTAAKLTSAKHTYKQKGVILDIIPADGGFNVRVLARITPPAIKPARGEKNARKNAGSSMSIRRAFWRNAFLKAMDSVPIANIDGASAIATAAVALYDEWVVKDAQPKEE